MLLHFQVIDIRNKISLTRKQFATLLGCDTRTVTRWEDKDGPNPTGAAEQILGAYLALLNSFPDQVNEINNYLRLMTRSGGLSYLVFNSYINNKK